MPQIIPVSDLRNYSEVLGSCQKGNPVFLTKNGRGRYVVLDIEEYEKQIAALHILTALSEGENSVKDESDWLTTEQAFAGLEE